MKREMNSIKTKEKYLSFGIINIFCIIIYVIAKELHLYEYDES